MQETKSNKSQPQSQFYFELKLVRLLVREPSKKPLRISLFKGIQKLNETKEVILPSELVVDLETSNSSLSFYIPDFDKKVSSVFRIVLEEVQPSKEIGSFNISSSAFIVSLVKDNTSSFFRKDTFDENYTLEYVLFVEKTKADLNQSIRSFEEENSILYRTEPPNLIYNHSLLVPPRMSAGEMSRNSSLVESPTLGRRIPRQLKPENPSNISNVESKNNHEVTFSESVRVVSAEPTVLMKRNGSFREGSTQTKLILLASVVALGVIAYFLVAINENSKQLEYLKSKLGQIQF